MKFAPKLVLSVLKHPEGWFWVLGAGCFWLLTANR